MSSHQLFKNLLKLLLRTHINIKFIISVFKNPIYSALGEIMTFFPSQFSATPIWPNLRPFVATWRRDSQSLSCPALYLSPILDPWQFLLRDFKRKKKTSSQFSNYSPYRRKRNLQSPRCADWILESFKAPILLPQSIHSLRIYRKEERESRLVVSDSLWPHGLYSPWNSPGQNTGLGSLSVLQGIFPTQVSRTASRFFTSWATRETQEYWSG